MSTLECDNFRGYIFKGPIYLLGKLGSISKPHILGAAYRSTSVLDVYEMFGLKASNNWYSVLNIFLKPRLFFMK